MFMIVGLGNPGRAYQRNRHNVGFMVIDALLDKKNKALKKRFNSEFIKDLFEEKDVLFIKPMTYMNLSGLAVQNFLSFYHIDMKNLFVIHDDVDLELGRIKIKTRGGDSGHNGLSSIIENINFSEFIRIRVGTGRPESNSLCMTDYVLSDFNSDESPILQKAITLACDAVKMIIKHGIVKAMNTYNTKSHENSEI